VDNGVEALAGRVDALFLSRRRVGSRRELLLYKRKDLNQTLSQLGQFLLDVLYLLLRPQLSLDLLL
jgi:hypothetical protein